jgi:hypothetical protein
MIFRINSHAEPRVRAALARRNELLRMYTREMPAEYEQELGELDRIIAAAVSVGIRKPMDEGEQYIAMSQGW